MRSAYLPTPVQVSTPIRSGVRCAPPTSWSHSSWHGNAYYALALLFGKGSFRAFRVWPGPWAGPRARSRHPVENSVGRADSMTVEGHLATAGHSNLLLDLRSATRSFGAYVPRWSYRLHRRPTVPAREYDGLAYVATTTSSRPLPPVGAAW
ncbi:erythromycin esterase family protein [Streptomyces sp. MST-110588]|nr:erythromycin esterase family protein [Streptomyces sp. MST-110588]